MMPNISHKASLVVYCQLTWEKTYSRHVGPVQKVIRYPSQTFHLKYLKFFCFYPKVQQNSSVRSLLLDIWETFDLSLHFAKTWKNTFGIQAALVWQEWLVGPTSSYFPAVDVDNESSNWLHVIYPFRKQRHWVSLSISEALSYFAKNTRSVKRRGGHLSQVLLLSQPLAFLLFLLHLCFCRISHSRLAWLHLNISKAKLLLLFKLSVYFIFPWVWAWCVVNERIK